MKKRMIRAMAIILAGAMLTSTARITDQENDKNTLSTAYYNEFCSHLGNELYRTVGKTSISNANLVSSYLSGALEGTRFVLNEDGSVKAYVSDTQWKKLAKGVNEILEDETLTEEVMVATKGTMEEACKDLTDQVENAKQMVEYCDSAIDSVNAQFGEKNAEVLLATGGDIADNEEVTSELESISEKNEQIASLEKMKEEFQEKATDLKTYEYYYTSNSLGDYVTEESDGIQDSYELLFANQELLSDEIESIMDALEKDGANSKPFASAVARFESDFAQAVSDVKYSCDSLLESDMNGADLTRYMQIQRSDVDVLSANLSANALLTGEYTISEETGENEGTEASTEGQDTGTQATYSQEELDNIKASLEEIKAQLDSFEEKYGNAIADVSENVNAITSLMQIMCEGGIYEQYTVSLNNMTSELAKSLDELRTENDSATDKAIDDINAVVEKYNTISKENVSDIQKNVDRAITTIKTDTMNMEEFQEYQTNVVALAATSSDTISALQTTIETEAAERKTADEKLSQSIGTIRSNLMYIIGSNSISNVGSSITAAIGNTSLAGIGDGTISGAISTLNNNQENRATMKAYKSLDHTVAINWKAYLDDNIVPSIVIDGDSFDVIPNNIRSDYNYKITDMKVVIVSGVWKLQLDIYIDGRLYTQFIDLSDS